MELCETLQDRVDLIKKIEDGSFKEVLVRETTYAKALIWALVVANMKFQITNYGLGVRKIKRQLPEKDPVGKRKIK